MFCSALTAECVLAHHPRLYFTFPTRSCCDPDSYHDITVGLLKIRARILAYVILSLSTCLYPYLADSVVVSPQPRFLYISGGEGCSTAVADLY